MDTKINSNGHTSGETMSEEELREMIERADIGCYIKYFLGVHFPV